MVDVTENKILTAHQVYLERKSKLLSDLTDYLGSQIWGTITEVVEQIEDANNAGLDRNEVLAEYEALVEHAKENSELAGHAMQAAINHTNHEVFITVLEFNKEQRNKETAEKPVVDKPIKIENLEDFYKEIGVTSREKWDLKTAEKEEELYQTSIANDFLASGESFLEFYNNITNAKQHPDEFINEVIQIISQKNNEEIKNEALHQDILMHVVKDQLENNNYFINGFRDRTEDALYSKEYPFDPANEEFQASMQEVRDDLYDVLSPFNYQESEINQMIEQLGYNTYLSNKKENIPEKQADNLEIKQEISLEIINIIKNLSLVDKLNAEERIKEVLYFLVEKEDQELFTNILKTGVESDFSTFDIKKVMADNNLSDNEYGDVYNAFIYVLEKLHYQKLKTGKHPSEKEKKYVKEHKAVEKTIKKEQVSVPNNKPNTKKESKKAVPEEKTEINNSEKAAEKTWEILINGEVKNFPEKIIKNSILALIESKKISLSITAKHPDLNKKGFHTVKGEYSFGHTRMGDGNLRDLFKDWDREVKPNQPYVISYEFDKLNGRYISLFYKTKREKAKTTRGGDQLTFTLNLDELSSIYPGISEPINNSPTLMRDLVEEYLKGSDYEPKKLEAAMMLSPEKMYKIENNKKGVVGTQSMKDLNQAYREPKSFK